MTELVGVYMPVPPALTSGEQAQLQVDSTGALKVTGGTGGGGGGSSGGTANASDPTYLDGATNQPLSLTTKGRLRVEVVDQGTSAAAAVTTITTGGTAQTLFAANTARRGVVVQNQSAGDLYIGNPAAQNQSSLKIPSGGYYETPPNFSGTALIQIIGATAGQAFYAREHT